MTRPRSTRGRSRVSARLMIVIAAVMSVVAAACSGGDDPVSSETTTTSAATTTTTIVEVDPQAVADAGVLTVDDVPAGWESREPIETDASTNPCPEVAVDLLLVEPDGDAPGRAGFVARDPEPGLPTVRHEVYVYDDTAAAAAAFTVRSSGEYALCASAAGAEILEASEAGLAGRGFREASAGDIGTESSSWVVSFTIEEAGVSVDARFEIVTFRVGPVVSAVLLTNSPAFPLAAAEREAILGAAALRVQQAVSESSAM